MMLTEKISSFPAVSVVAVTILTWICVSSWSGSCQALNLDECSLALGMQSGLIEDSAITASSYLPDRGPTSARIRKEVSGGAWCPAQPIGKNSLEYLEIDLGRLQVVTLVETQGRFDNGQGQEFTEQYRLEFQREDGDGSWFRFRNRRGQEIFQGNTNTYISEMREVEPPIIARRVRFIPYSSHSKIVCLRVELYGCVWTDGTVSYSMRQGEQRSHDVDLSDATYDGMIINGQLSGGLGQLTDGQHGQSNFRVDRLGFGAKGYEWVGWRNDSFEDPSGAVSIVFRFDAVRNFSVVKLHVNNMFTKDVRVFRLARLTFSGGGESLSSVEDQPSPSLDTIEYVYLRDAVMETARFVSIPLENRIGNEVQLKLFFDARWLMISEVQFESELVVISSSELTTVGLPQVSTGTVRAMDNDDVAVDQPPKVATPDRNQVEDQDGSANQESHYTPSSDGGLNQTMVHSKSSVKDTTVQRVDDSSYVGIIVGTLTALCVILLVVTALILLRRRLRLCVRSKCNTPKATKLVTGPPTSSASLLAYAPPVSTYNQSVSVPAYNTVTKDSTLPQQQNSSSMSDPLLPCLVSPYATANIADVQLPVPVASTVTMATELTALSAVDIAAAIEFPRSNLKFVEMLGEGQFGEVFLCETFFAPVDCSDTSANGSDTFGCKMVAVKVLRRDADSATRISFQQEASIMSHLSDANITQLLGVCFADEPNCLILEYLKFGDLKRYLRRHVVEGTMTKRANVDILSYGCLIYMATQIASGMKYLEELNLVHRDLAARNVLVGEHYSVKISDFGISHNVYPADYYTTSSKVLLPLRWMAWESVLFSRFSTKSDVWSFGVTTWEILTFAHEMPFASLSNEEVVDNSERWYRGAAAGAEPLWLERPALCPREIYDLLRECWQRDEERRPTFHEVHMFLRRKNSGFNPHEEQRNTAAAPSAATLARVNGSSATNSVTPTTTVPSFV
jgi:discoidin domain receptor family protein 2